MWESLGTNRRQDRVLHGAAKFLNVIAGLVMFPVWLVGQRIAGRLAALLGRAKRPTLPVAPTRAPSLDSVLAELQRIPHNLHPSRSATLRKGLADLSMFIGLPVSGILYYVLAKSIDVEAETRIAEREAEEVERFAREHRLPTEAR